MPYRWDMITEAPEQSGASPVQASGTARFRLTLWPHRSLTPSGFVTFIAATVLLLALPVLALLGQPALWFVLAFATPVVWAVWVALRRTSRDAHRGEILTLTPDRLTVEHTLTAPPRTWETNPYWVQVRLTPTGGPVPDYLTLKGGGREIELGAFLTPDERRALAGELREKLALIRQAH